MENQFVTDLSGNIKETPIQRPDVRLDISGSRNDVVSETLDERLLRGIVEARIKREFFINSLCETLKIPRGSIGAIESDDLKSVVNEAVWTRPGKGHLDLHVQQFTFEYVAARIIEIYGLNQTRAKKMRDDAKTFRDFLVAVVTYDAEAEDARNKKMDADFKTSAWGFDPANIDTAEGEKKSSTDDNGTDPEKDRERLLLKEAASSNTRMDSILKKRLSTVTSAPVETSATPVETSSVSEQHPANQVMNDLVTHILPGMKKITITMTFET